MILKDITKREISVDDKVQVMDIIRKNIDENIIEVCKVKGGTYIIT